MPSKLDDLLQRKSVTDALTAQVQVKLRMGLELHQKGLLAQARAIYEDILRSQPEHADSLHLLGLVAAQTGEPRRAIELIGKAIRINPTNAAFHYNYGKALHECRQLTAAVASFDKAIAIRQDYAEAYCNRGVALRELKQLEAAVASCDEAIALKSDYALAYCNRGVALHELNQLNAALASFEKAIAIRPDFAEAYSNRGATLRELNQPEAALASCDRAIAVRKDYPEAHSNRGMVLQELKQLDAAVASYDKAISIKADHTEAYWNKSLALLLGGNFDEGWQLFEWRQKLRQDSRRSFPQPLWRGMDSLQDKVVLLYSEQGLGDAIQFCRYARSVSRLGGKVILEVPRPLVGLLHRLEGVREVLAKGTALPTFHYHCPLLSLPLAFKTNLHTVPDSQAYLRCDDNKVSRWATRLGSKTKPRVGIVWSGSPGHKNDHRRSIALSTLIPYLPRTLEYVSLQKEVRATDRATLEAHSHIRHFGAELDDFDDTAALCELMDVIVSVDTSVAHLGGALGKSTWVLLPYSPDWRWLLDRDDSPWYASMRLYRQDAACDWGRVLGTLRQSLEAL